LIVPMVGDWLGCRRQPAVRFCEVGVNASGSAKNATSFFIVAFVWCVLFFSLSGCKRGAYILPAFPLMALTLGAYLTHGHRVHNWRPWIAGFAMVYVLILGATWTLLPDYHRRFGMRRQVEAQINVANELPVVCLPKRWDSVSFYLRREVAVGDASVLLAGEPTLVFVKRQGALPAMLRGLPAEWAFFPLDTRRHNVVVGMIQRR